MSADGAFVITWEAFGESPGIFMQRYSSTGRPAGGEVNVDTVSAGQLMAPSVSIAPDGGSLVAWVGQDQLKGAIYAQWFDSSGRRRGDEIVVDSSDNRILYDTSSGFDAAGNAVIVWDAHVDGTNFVLARRYGPSGESLGAPFRIDTDLPGFKFPLEVAVAPEGGFCVAYPSDPNVFVRQFNASGEALGSELRTNSDVQSSKFFPSIGSSKDGKLVIAWLSNDQDGSNSGIYAQRYVSPVNPATVGGRVWSDFDRDGIRDAGEPDYPGVAVELFSTTGAPVGTTTTSNTGSYRFDNLNPGDSYYVHMIAPPRTSLSPANIGNDDARDSEIDPATGRSGSITLGPSETNTTIDAGIIPTTTVAGVAWYDADGNGVRGPSEVGLEGVTVELLSIYGTLIERTTTGVGGAYAFHPVQFGGNYRVRFVAGPNRIFSPSGRGGDPAVDSDVDPGTGQAALFTTPDEVRVDAGLLAPASLSGTLFYDQNSSQSRDPGENGLAGWTVFLDADADGQLDLDEKSTVTQVDGAYSFAGLLPGTWHIDVVQQSHWERTTAAAALTRKLIAGEAASRIDLGVRAAAPLDLRAARVGPEFPVNTTTAGSQFDSSVASDAAGNYVVTWRNQDSVMGRLFNADGQPRGDEFFVAETRLAYAHTVSMAGDGRFVVIWQVAGGQLAGQRFDAAGGRSGPVFTVNSSAGDHYAPNVAMERDGDFVVTWAAPDGGEFGVYARRFSADGLPRGDEFLVNSATIDNQDRNDVAVDEQGDFVVVYRSVKSGGRGSARILARRYDGAGNALGDEFQVSPDVPSGEYDLPHASMNVSGEFIVTYAGFDADSLGVGVRRYDAQGRPMGPSFIANTKMQGAQWHSAVALADDGSFVVTWDDSAIDPASEVRGQLFNGSGLRVGSEFAVNRTAAFAQGDPAVAIQPTGFVVTWSSDRQDGDSSGIYGQRFATFTKPAAVSGRVFIDGDGDNLRGPAEGGLGGVMVSLLDEQGLVADTTFTAFGGSYRFEDVRPGVYSLQFQTSPPPAYVYSLADVGSDDTIDSDVDPTFGSTASFTLAPNQTNLVRDAGLQPLGSVSGVKFDDVDGDGVRDPEETGLEGRTLFLDADGDGERDVGEQSASTAVDGSYRFNNLRPGDYRLADEPSEEWDSTTSPILLTLRMRAGRNVTNVNSGSRSNIPDHYFRALGAEQHIDMTEPFAFAARPDGDYIIVGHVSGEVLRADLFGRLFDASGEPKSDWFVVNAFVNGSQFMPAAAFGPNGDLVVAWYSEKVSARPQGLYARRFDSAGRAKGDEFPIQTSTQNDFSGPWNASVAVGADGGFVITWEEYVADGSFNYDVFARCYKADGNPVADAFRVNSTSAGVQTDAKVRMDAAGDFAVVWRDSTDEGLHGRRYDAEGSALGAEFRVPTILQSGALAMNAAGEFVVAGGAFDGTSHRVVAVMYDAAGVQRSVPIEVAPAVATSSPDVGIDGRGYFVVTWHAPDGDEDGVFARRYSSGGVASGPAFQVNTSTAHEQWGARVSVLENGTFAVAWRTAFEEVIVRRYEPTPVRGYVGGFVWDDADGDGMLDGGEAPVPGMVVELLDAAGALVGHTITSAAGVFRFDPFQPGAAYSFRYILPEGRIPTRQNQGRDDARDSDADPATAQTIFFAPAARRVDVNYGVGLVPGGEISGVKFDDRNANGLRDAGEPALPGFTVFLDLDGDGLHDDGEPLQITDADGDFAFTDLPAGFYRVRETPQPYWSLTAAPKSLDFELKVGQSVTGVLLGSHRIVTVSRRVAFYNHSFFDGGNTASDKLDDSSIASDKLAFLPGQAPTFANVTSYSKGINGVMIDLTGLPTNSTLTTNDFIFRSSSTLKSGIFSAGPVPVSIKLRRGEGIDGSDRIVLTWADFNAAATGASQAVANGWLEVTLKANSTTGLSSREVFRFGNLIGETGDSDSIFAVTAADLVRVRNAVGKVAALDSQFDFNRDGVVNAADLVLVRNRVGTSLPAVPPSLVFSASRIAPADG